MGEPSVDGNGPGDTLIPIVKNRRWCFGLLLSIYVDNLTPNGESVHLKCHLVAAVPSFEPTAEPFCCSRSGASCTTLNLFVAVCS
jgi:hypothetical protein